jgi:hypothetical protein
MAGDNGSHVTWRELNLALGPIREDVGEIKEDVKAIREQSWLGPRGKALVTTVVGGVLVLVISGLVSAAIALGLT